MNGPTTYMPDGNASNPSEPRVLITPVVSLGGEDIPVLTISKGTLSIALTIRDLKTYAVGFLVVLASHNDAFAMRLLDEQFASTDAGDIPWPGDAAGTSPI